MNASLTRWLRPLRRSNLSHLKVTVYTRAQCCCCHKALDLLKDFQRRHGFSIEEVDVDSDPELVRLYGEEVPVVTIDGRKSFKLRVDAAALRAALDRAGAAGR